MIECEAEDLLLTAGYAADQEAVRVLADRLGVAEAETVLMIRDLLVEVEAGAGMMEEVHAAGDEAAEMVITYNHRAKVAVAYLRTVKVALDIELLRLVTVGAKHNYSELESREVNRQERNLYKISFRSVCSLGVAKIHKRAEVAC